MEGLEIIVLLGAAVLTGAVLAPRLRVAAPLLLLVFGLILGFVPELQDIELPPETVLLVFLPVMLFWESLTTSLRSVRRDFRGIVLMSTLMVVATAFGVAGIAHLLGLPWNAALILGAALAPPDATAVAALGRMLPHRNFMLLKAESLTNDGTALVVYGIAVGISAGGSYTPLTITGLVVQSYLGGAVAGAAVAGIAYLVMRRLNDALLMNIALLITPFAAFLAAEVIHASGVLAVVVAGLIVSFTSARVSTAASRRQTESTWPLGSYLLNGSLFVLIGLQVQAIAHDIDAGDIGRLLLTTVAVWLTLLVVRFTFQSLLVMIIRALDRRPSQRERRMSYRARVVSAVAGFRGAVSLAIALSVPLMMDGGQALPGRNDIIFITAGAIVLTLLVQGPLLPKIVHWAKLPDDTADTELQLTERALNDAALSVLQEAGDTAAGKNIGTETRQLILHEYESRREILKAQTKATEQQHGKEAHHTDETLLRMDILARKRQVLQQLRLEGAIDDAIARRFQTRLDVEEQRLTGVEPID
ncbi:Na+/H+ antiporter [Arthrobacter sp. ISL-95]|uniref:Na+/H+ antiporter n=1 Tax=Arthrobacter sp. ISL-95 TaxID=2819116 RepID=UPI001BECF915|nr:Na+/H+ antiporter [Arthrobacter sp. ISL-95]MBT2586482.1 Na+/H+ antiporter [Arthrobacter sp. ISL-95]